MDADFAGLVEKVNNFSMDGIFASDKRLGIINALARFFCYWREIANQFVV